jgi:histidine triad (HIT) family protein
MNPDGLNFIQSNGEAATQTVPHLHVHAVPRWVGDPIADFWPDDSPWTDRELDSAHQRITERL